MTSVSARRIICFFLIVLSRLAFADAFPPLGVWYGHLAGKPIRLCVEQDKAAYHYAGHSSEIQLSFTDSKRWVESVKGKATGHWDINSDSGPNIISTDIYGSWGKPGTKTKPHSFHLYHLEDTDSACSSERYRATLLSFGESRLSLPLPQARPSVLAMSKSAALLQGNGDLWYWSEDQPQPRMIGKEYARVALGEHHFLGIKADGSLWGWGSNDFGQLGSEEVAGGYVRAESPILLGNDYVAVAATRNASLAIKKDGTLWMWGGLQMDTKGNVVGKDSKPTLIGKSFVALSALNGTYAAIKNDGTLWMWGNNDYGRLGLGDTRLLDSDYPDVPTPTLVGTDFTQVSVGDGHTAAIKKDGSLWTWGDGRRGQLGNGKADEGSPIPVKIGDGFVQVTSGSGENTSAVKLDGSLWLWGDNATYRYWPFKSGRFGNCSTQGSHSTPVRVGEDFAQVELGWHFLVALKPDGSVWTLGWPWEGDQLDIPSQCRKPTRVVFGGDVSSWLKPTKAVLKAKLHMPAMPTNILSIAAGGSHSAMVKADGTLWTWGNNEQGQLANGKFHNHNLPERVGEGFNKVMIEDRYTLAIKNDGSLLRWGAIPKTFAGGDISQDTDRALSPTTVFAGVETLTGHSGHTLGLDSNGTILFWYEYADVHRMPPMVYGRDIKDIGVDGAGRFAIRKDGSLWMLPHIPTSTPPPRHVGNDFLSIVVGDRHAYGIKADGSLWAWGDNQLYQLGDGTATVRMDPVRIGTGFVQVAIGRLHGIALAADGSVWTWGTNDVGVIGDGTATTRPQPAKIGTGFAMVAAGDYHNLALKTDGTLWAWGANEDGQLGDGTNVYRLSPTQIFPSQVTKNPKKQTATSDVPIMKPASTKVTSVRVGLYFSCVSFADEQVKCWGSDTKGQLKSANWMHKEAKPRVIEKDAGVSELFRIDPVIKCKAQPRECLRISSKLPFLKGATSIETYEDNDVCAIKNGRILCTEHDNRSGMGWIVDNIHDAVAFDYRERHGCAILADGRVKCWGRNQYGQLGNGTLFESVYHVPLATEVVDLYP